MLDDEERTRLRQESQKRELEAWSKGRDEMFSAWGWTIFVLVLIAAIAHDW